MNRPTLVPAGRRALLVLFSFAALGSAMTPAAQTPSSKVVVHEWGTFTTVAGEAGQAIDWTPLGGPADLPCFVEHYKNRQYKIIGDVPESQGSLDYEAARWGLVAKVRMETPVLYFYSPTEADLSVSVRFQQGLLTEWYPTATSSQANVVPTILQNPNVAGSLSWPNVHVAPGRTPAFPKGDGASHYYAARDTDAAPLVVQGQEEKFLFYRGVASFPVPIEASLPNNGSVRVKNLGSDAIPDVILFENRAGRMSYLNYGALKTSADLARPVKPADFAELRADLIKMLMKTGLFQREAEAMVETWRDSWFEEGTRIFYVMPARTVDAILPLDISPAPASVSRAFVGRMEVLTPEILVQAQTAIAANDVASLERMGRFLGPIADRLAARMTSVSDREKVKAIANQVFAAYLAKFSTCR